MTTIAYCLKSKRVACDSRIANDNGDIITDTASKRYERLGVVFFIAGAVADVEEITNAFCAGKHRVRKALQSQALAWTGKKMFELLAESGELSWHPVVSERGAIGSGEDFAMAALHAGATPRAAVIAAAKRNCHTGGRVVTHRLERK